jgi:hypothetical protein
MVTDKSDEYSPEETARRRDAVLKILVNTPPQPQSTRQVQSKSRKTTALDRAARKPSDRQKKSE